MNSSNISQIRAKRLAKLGGNQTPTTTPSSDTATTQPSTNENAESSPAENPFAQVLSKPNDGEKKTSPQIKVTPRPASPAKRERDGSEKPRSRPEKPAESLEIWQDRNLRSIFKITLSEADTRDAHGNRVLFLASTRSELEEQDSPIQMSMEVLEGAIAEAASQAPNGKPFEYLLTCFKRVSKAIRGAKFGPEDPKMEVLREARRLCMSYCIFAVTMPEMFENVPSTNPLVEHLLADPECDNGICSDFLQEATNRFDEDESIKDAIVGAAEELSRQLAQKSMVDDYQFFLRGFRNLMRFPKIVEAVTQSENWIPGTIEAQDIEKNTLLGPFFRLSPIQDEVAENYFSAPRTRDRGFIANAQNASRLTLRTHQEELYQLSNRIVRSGASAREKILGTYCTISMTLCSSMISISHHDGLYSHTNSEIRLVRPLRKQEPQKARHAGRSQGRLQRRLHDQRHQRARPALRALYGREIRQNRPHRRKLPTPSSAGRHTRRNED